MKKLLGNDYRKDISGVDSYGRRKCDHCKKRRKVNAYWKDTNKVLCTECSRAGMTALAFSVRSRNA